jgi:putative hydrolase of the HAD superfamily
MNKPKMILFDYGQTLISEEQFDGIAGTKAVLEKCVNNPKNISAEEIQALANEMNKDIGRYNPDTNHLYWIEVHNHPFQNYLYEYFGLTKIVSHLELETTFCDAASPGKSTKNIEEFLLYLRKENIRSSVVSNISFSGEALRNRISALLPQNDFEFILATSEYVFRKPHRRVFELATRKARLEPNEIWYCGDNGICDVDGAKEAGLFPVWYNGAHEGHIYTPQNECLIISDWLELVEILEGAE